MYFYEVQVSSPRFHGEGLLSYASSQLLKMGYVVIVPLQNRLVPAVVIQKTTKPTFAVKEIKRLVSPQPLPVHWLEYWQWLQSYYPTKPALALSLFLPSTLTQISRSGAPAMAKPAGPSPIEPPLTKEQIAALEQLRKSPSSSYLLHGDTGSGKTRVYTELIKDHLANDRSVILLTPEIGLTPQLARQATSLFGDQVIVLHSNLTPAARRQAWLRILESRQPLVVIGPRSALFSPIKNLGLIVIDEFHDSAYKQEQSPHYIASRVAAKLASLHGAPLILGSATPSVTDYYFFEQKGLPIVRMISPARDTATKPATIEIVDLAKRDNFNRSPWLSTVLLDGLDAALNRHEQTLIFLNRRGTARLVMCQNCHWQATCPRCDLPLTYHADSHKMQCHTCGYQDKAPSSCPQCGSADILFKSIGTKAVLEEVRRLYPKAKINRFDSDSKKSESLEQLYDSIEAGEADIIVGTQMLSKGLDLPKLSLVGIVAADTSLYFPDYTAEERTFQMLTQIMGRVSRGHRAGTVVIQSHHPTSAVIQAATTKDYASFYHQQLEARRAFNFPPFCYVLKITTERATRSSAQAAANELMDKLKAKASGVDLSGPSPAFSEKQNNKYRWQLLARSKNRQSLVKLISWLPKNISFDLDPIDLL